MTTIIEKKSRLNCNICKFYTYFTNEIQICNLYENQRLANKLVGYKDFVNNSCSKFKINKIIVNNNLS